MQERVVGEIVVPDWQGLLRRGNTPLRSWTAGGGGAAHSQGTGHRATFSRDGLDIIASSAQEFRRDIEEDVRRGQGRQGSEHQVE